MNESLIKQSPLYFSNLSYPLFGRGVYSENNPPITVINSPYYWWYKFLQLNEDYKVTVSKKGIGKCGNLYKDFGNVYTYDFKKWWNHNAKLFAEPKKNYSMRIAQSHIELASFNNNEVVNLVVPLNWSQRSLKKKFTQLILSKVQKAKKGLNVDLSKATYKISGRWRIDAFQKAYAVYITKLENPNLSWADIAVLAKLDLAKGYKVGEKGNKASDIRRVASIATIRHYKRALTFINSATTNSFPY